MKRVQAWRQTHPGYWQSNGTLSGFALQDDSLAQVVESNEQTEVLMNTALQDILNQQTLHLIGIIAH